MEAPPPAPLREREQAGTRGVGWAALAVGAAGLWLLELVGVALRLADGEPWRALLGLGWVLCAWWVHRGAWLRTTWGGPAPGTEPPWEEPVLTDRRARWYVGLGLTCVASAAVAVILQALVLAD
jgi:hypothetical protein